MIVDKVELFLKKYNLIDAKNTILVAFSGGFDSMCLLHVLMQLKRVYKFKLCAIHLNHNWRGAESDKDEERCKNFCREIDFYSEKLPNDTPHTETFARNARYEFFEKCSRKFNSKIILTAHNANDNAETVFYRILKGTGINGLDGISENRGIYYRPLLNIYRAEIEKYCKVNKLEPNIDSSNYDTKYARNNIRQKIFPEIKKSYPNMEKALNNLSQNAKQANLIIKNNIKYLTDYSTDEFCTLNDFYQSAIVHNFFIVQNLDYDKIKIEKLLNFIIENKNSKSGKKISLTTDKWLFISNHKIEVLSKVDIKNEFDFSIKINEEGEYRFGNDKFIIKQYQNSVKKFPKDDELMAYVNISDMDFELRYRKDGDIIRPYGMNGHQKLKKYLNEKKIPNHEKDKLICLCKNNEVFWVAGYGLSENLKVEKNPTHVIKIERGVYEN